ncbi:hypothetical protein PT2222_80283 [Paraburkholderia tropica]
MRPENNVNQGVNACWRGLARQRQLDQFVRRGVGLHDAARDAPLAHHDDAIGHADHFGEIARHHDHAASRFREFVQQVVDLGARAHVDAARGFVHQEHFDALGEPARQNHLLLIAARERADRGVAIARLDRELLDVVVGQRAFALRVEQEARGAEMAARADVQVVGHRGDRHDAFLLAILGTQRHARPHRVARTREIHALAVEFDVTRARALGAVEQLHQFGTSRADEPEEADDLAAPRLERHGFGEPRTHQPFRLDQHRTGLACAIAVDVLDRAPHHRRDQPIAVEVGDRIESLDALAVAEHRHAVAQLVDFVHAVRDVDDRAAVRAQRVDDAKEVFGFARRERTRRFVEGDHARVAHQRLADLDHLALADREILHRRARIDALAEPLQFRHRALDERLLVEHAEAVGQLPEHQVVGHGQLGHEMQFLIDDRDARVERGARGREALLHAAQAQRARLRLVHAREHLEQRGLARAVLAHQAVHLARAHVERHAVERLHARKTHGDAVELQIRALPLLIPRLARTGRVRGICMCHGFSHCISALAVASVSLRMP